MKKGTCIIAFFSLVFFSHQLHAQKNKSTFKIVGYYSLRSALTADLATIPFNELTHINLFFLNPDTLGNFVQDLSGLAPFIKEAHAKHVKVLPSIAGGGKHEYYHELLKDNKRDKFINDLLKLVLDNDFDGIDVDLEGSDIDSNYEKLAIGLAKAFRPHKKLVTSAIAIFYKDVLSDKALAQYDFVNIMSYDHTGPWTPSKPGPHSTYDHAVADLNYFGVVRKIPKEKLVLGVGFYGYGFGPALTSPATSMNFGDILSKYPGSENFDQINLPDSSVLYYNGIPTIRKKTALAREKASGIMIWQILGDAPGEVSLLRAINDEAHKKKR
jgi:chitinase